MRWTLPRGLLAATLLLAASLPATAANLRIASQMSMTGQPLAHAQIFARKVEERFPGEFDFRLYPSAQLGDERAIISNIKVGSLEMAAIGSGPLALEGKLGVFDLPFLFKSWGHAQRALTGEFGKEAAQLLEENQNMVVLGIYGLDFRHVVSKPRPLAVPVDFEGMKLRVIGSEYRTEAFSLLGANPVPVSWSEVFTALQTGVADAAESTYAGFYEENLFEAANYLSKTNHVFGPTFLLMSKAAFGQLTEEQQTAFREIAREMSDEAFAKSQEISNSSLAELEKTMEVNDVDIEALQAKVQPLYEKYADSEGDEWVELIRAAETE
ncbi:TRAP transporter substrate-binding protein [Lutibaculum baratangense]|uniref:C4-dicarboxylate transport system C4-dicarboxylate-binding protein n=1 Tax=Lutibaculum baratangense AMV1 TaxID=631454 RepID=V4QVJ8_9HYPH|nr:TRAP transporter substrate-binding protein [Lutibaculum baratangense]ESR23787.1 C4-dicarboxylate transport system C4-dicarboxylate-binding protein [Lutibaculum baratangense AMV1]